MTLYVAGLLKHGTKSKLQFLVCREHQPKGRTAATPIYTLPSIVVPADADPETAFSCHWARLFKTMVTIESPIETYNTVYHGEQRSVLVYAISAPKPVAETLTEGFHMKWYKPHGSTLVDEGTRAFLNYHSDR